MLRISAHFIVVNLQFNNLHQHYLSSKGLQNIHTGQRIFCVSEGIMYIMQPINQGCVDTLINYQRERELFLFVPKMHLYVINLLLLMLNQAYVFYILSALNFLIFNHIAATFQSYCGNLPIILRQPFNHITATFQSYCGNLPIYPFSCSEPQ